MMAPPQQGPVPLGTGDDDGGYCQLPVIHRPLRTMTRHNIWLLLTGLGVLLWVPYILANPVAIDAHAYYVGEYGVTWGTADSYVYSPAFSQAVEPLRWLGWDGFRTAWRALNVAVLAVLTGPFVGPLLFVRPIALEVNLGNIHILMGAAIALGFRWPAAWAFILLTKVTPGIGLLWFLVRREWRNLGIALGATAVIAAVSFALAPGLWFDWLRTLAAQTGDPGFDLLISAPLELRLPAAAALVTWGALRGYRWTVLGAAFLALPAVWLAATAMVVGLRLDRDKRPRGIRRCPCAADTPDLGVGRRHRVAVHLHDIAIAGAGVGVGIRGNDDRGRGEGGPEGDRILARGELG